MNDTVFTLDDDPQKTTIKDRQKLYKDDWLLWIEDWLHINTTPWPDDKKPDDWKPSDGYPLWSKEVEIIKAVQKHKKVAVKSSHGIGKTFIAAVISLCIFYIERATGLTTSKTFRQVRRQLWAEVHKIYNRAEAINKSQGKSLGGQLNQTSLHIGGKWYMEGFTTTEDGGFQGFHESKLFLIGDEACELAPETYSSFDSILTTEDVYVLLIGNPTNPHSEFRKCFEKGSEWHQIKVDSWMTPNVRHGENMFPFLVTHDWPAMMLKKYKGDEDHPVFRGKVRAEFPLEGEDQLITWDLIQAAIDRNLDNNSPIISIGVDVARKGSDLTVYGARQANGRFRIYRTTSQERETETAGRVKLDLKNEGPIEVDPDNVCANVDDIGVGGGVNDILFEDDYPHNEVVVSESPDQWQDEDGIFLNKRAVFYWKLRQAFVDGDVDIDPNDIELQEELHAIQKEYTSRGKIKMISKDKIRDILGRSCDRSDDMMLAFAEGEAENRRDMVRSI